MKKVTSGLLALTLASALTAPAFAGNLEEPIMEPVITPEVIEEDTAASGSHDIIVPLTALVLFGVAVASN